MTNDHSDRKPIKPPDKHHPDDKVRTFIEAALEVVPFAGSIIKLFGSLFRTQAQRSVDKWEADISGRTNEHTERLDQHEEIISPKTQELTGGAVKLAVALARDPNCDGMSGPGRDLDALCDLVPDVRKQEVEDAAFELHMHGLCEIDRAIGKKWWLRLTQKFYEQIDHQVMGWNATTQDNARTLAHLMLENQSGERAAALQALSGWEKRRFNPAFKYLLRFIPDKRISHEIQAAYPSSGVVLLQEDRAALRAFVSTK